MLMFKVRLELEGKSLVDSTFTLIGIFIFRPRKIISPNMNRVGTKACKIKLRPFPHLDIHSFVKQAINLYLEISRKHVNVYRPLIVKRVYSWHNPSTTSKTMTPDSFFILFFVFFGIQDVTFCHSRAQRKSNVKFLKNFKYIRKLF